MSGSGSPPGAGPPLWPPTALRGGRAPGPCTSCPWTGRSASPEALPVQGNYGFPQPREMSKRRLCLPWVCFLSTENKTQQTHGRRPADPRGQIARVPPEAPAPAPGGAPGRLPRGPRDLGGPGWGAPSARVTDSGSRSSTGPGPPGAKVHTRPWAYGASSHAPHPWGSQGSEGGLLSLRQPGEAGLGGCGHTGTAPVLGCVQPREGAAKQAPLGENPLLRRL